MTPAGEGRHRLVLVTAYRWLHTAHLALSARDAGFDVGLVGPAGHPLAELGWVTPLGVVSPFRHADSVADALHGVGEGLLVMPVDDLSAAALFDAWDRGLLGAVASASVVRSLGPPETFGPRRDRVVVADLARDAGVDVPTTLGVVSTHDLEAALSQVGLPAVLKTDGSTGSQGVVFAHDGAEAREAFARLGRRGSVLQGLARWWRDDDATYVAPSLSRTTPRVSVQGFVPGVPATLTVACWKGEVLGTVALKVVRPVELGSGPATLVEPVATGEMGEAADAVVKALGLSGLCGLDFHLRPDGGTSFLELNARATPTAHLPTGAGESLLDLLAPHFGAHSSPRAGRTAPLAPIALYPQERVRDPASPWTGTEHEDVPVAAPDVVALMAARLGTPIPSARARVGRARGARSALRGSGER